MEQLPDELLEWILDYCHFSSLKALRGTCNRLAWLTAPRVFEHVHCALLPESMQKLYDISAHPDLKQMVKKLSFHRESMPYFQSQAEWERYIHLRPQFEQFSAQFLMERGLYPLGEMDFGTGQAALDVWGELPRLGSSYLDYQRYCREQAHWGDKEMRLFRDAVCQLSNLTDAELGRPKAHCPIWGALWMEILQETHDQNFIRKPGLDGDLHLAYLLEGISAREGLDNVTPVRSLKISTRENVFWSQTQSASHRIWPEELGGHEVEAMVFHRRGAFTTLTRLELSISFSAGIECTAGGMRAFLQEARSLQELYFKYTDTRYYINKYRDDLRDPLQVLGTIRWPELRVLQIGFTTTEELLLGFFQRHAATLRRLSLKRMTLAIGHGNWASVIEKIPHILSLEHMYVKALYDHRSDGVISLCLFEFWSYGAYERSMLNYCLHGGTPPLLDPRDWNRAHPDQRTWLHFLDPDDERQPAGYFDDD